MAATVAFKDNSDRLRLEFHANKLNAWLRIVLLELAWWLRYQYDIQLVVTCLWRSEEENEADGGQPLSAHLDWRAADIRTWGFTPDIEDAVVKHLRLFWPVPMLHVLVHDSGAGRHMHININRRWMLDHPIQEA